MRPLNMFQNDITTTIFYFAPYSKYGSKIFLSKALFLTFFPDIRQLRSRHISKFVQATEREIIF